MKLRVNGKATDIRVAPETVFYNRLIFGCFLIMGIITAPLGIVLIVHTLLRRKRFK